MINEITNFVDELKPEIFSKNLELPEGLYLLVDIDQDGEILSNKVLSYKKNEEPEPIHFKFLEWVTNSNPVSANKSFDSRKKIFNQVCSPYAIGFKKKIYEKNLRENEDKKYKDIEDSIDLYFRSAEEFLIEEDEEFESFKACCKKNLIGLVEGLEEFDEIKSTSPIFILKKDAKIENQRAFHKRYLSEKVFNKEEYNKEIDEGVFGISDSVSGFNRKKTFLQHLTAPLDLNYRVSGNQAVNLWKFFGLWKNRQIPNPFPLFIDKQELTEEVVSIYNEDRRYGYTEIITMLIKQYNEEYLSNYYLLFFQSGQRGSQIVDLDFVPSFRYKIDPTLKIVEPFQLGGKVQTTISNVFELQDKALNKILNGQLVQKTKAGSKWLKYFDDVEFNPNYFTANGYNLFLKYRKAIYDYVYKSKHQAVTKRMFDDIMVNGILDDIRKDEFKDGSHSKGFQIKEKLNIWFSLYNYFETTINQTSIDMINKTEVLFEKLKNIADENSEKRIDSDEAFAFAAGQVIYYLLNQSEASNRSHALLEPFLQKTDVDLLKKEIAKSFDAYKHAIRFYRKKYGFDLIMAEVMGYESDEKNMKNLLPFILAGYFSKSVFYKDDK
ncbi:MAG: hypothetical protein WD059_10540 [Balneolaceae bacterium]